MEEKSQIMESKLQQMESNYDKMNATLDQMIASLKEIQIASARRGKDPIHLNVASTSTNPLVVTTSPAMPLTVTPMVTSSSVVPLVANPMMTTSPTIPLTATPMASPSSAAPLAANPQAFWQQVIPSSPLYIPTDANLAVTNRLPCLEVPTFTGEGVDGWLFQIDRYFIHHHVPFEQRLSVASFYLAGDALTWLRWMSATHQLSDWPSFARDLVSRFGPSAFWNAEIELNKLCQTQSVAAHILEFESLSARTPGLTTVNLMNRFLAGLKEDIHREIIPLKPASLQLAMGMARVADKSYLYD